MAMAGQVFRSASANEPPIRTVLEIGTGEGGVQPEKGKVTVNINQGETKRMAAAAARMTKAAQEGGVLTRAGGQLRRD